GIAVEGRAREGDQIMAGVDPAPLSVAASPAGGSGGGAERKGGGGAGVAAVATDRGVGDERGAGEVDRAIADEQASALPRAPRPPGRRGRRRARRRRGPRHTG